MKSTDLRLTSLISHGALAGETLPTTLTLLKWGPNETDRGTFIVDERTQAALEAQRKDAIFDRVLLDYEHNSDPKHKNYQPPPRKHGGAGVVFCDPERGLGLEDVTYTPSGREYAREYPDLSPVLVHTPDFVVVGLRAAALVPNGGVKNLSFFDATPLEAETGLPASDQQTLIDRVGALQAAIDALAEQVKSLKDENGWLREQRDSLEKLLSQSREISGLSAKIDTLSTSFDARLEAEMERRDKRLIISQASAEGKVVSLSDEAIAKLSAKDLADHVAALRPGEAPLQARTPADRPDPAEWPAEPDPAKVRARADEIRAAEGISWMSAWNRASAELTKTETPASPKATQD